MPEKGPVTKEEIEKWLALDERRKAADRLASDLKQQQEPLSDKLSEYVKEKGGADKTTLHCGFVLAFKERQSQVAWKQEFLKLSSLEEAERLRKAAPKVDYLVVTPAAK